MKTQFALTATFLLVFDIVKCTETENIINENSMDTKSIVHKKPTTYIDLLIEDLQDQEWDESEKPCYDQILTVLINVRNSTLWATWIWDSIQFPTGQFYGARYHLGNFDQCLRREWSNDNLIFTQYCLVDITLADTKVDKKITDLNPYDRAERYFHIKTDYNLKFNILSWGVCTPKACQARSVERFVRTLLRISHLGTINPNPKIMVGNCQVTQIPSANSTGLYLLMLGAVLLTVIACAFTYFTSKHLASKSNSIVMKIVSAFDLNSNAADFISVGKDEIKVIHGIRFLTACIVVFLHVIIMNITFRAGNCLDINDSFKQYLGFLSHGSVVVDTYFMMSGLLLMKTIKPETGRTISPFNMLLHRYFRLIWIFIITVLITITASPYLYHGPLWFKFAKVEQDACKKNWWVGFLMLGNYIDTSNIKYSILSFITIITLSATILFMGSAYQFREYNVIESTFFAALIRPIWAGLMAAFILLCVYGTLPHITDFLSWSAFVPLSKLSYGIYMCHFVFAMKITLGLRSPAWYDSLKILQDSIGIVVITGLLNLYIALFIESPLNNLVALALKTKPPKPKQINTNISDTVTLKSDSLKESGINKVATVEGSGFVSMKNEFVKDNAALHFRGLKYIGFNAEVYEGSNKNRVKSQNCTIKEEVCRKDL
ncbi:unnamed protein product [Parnassius mnemosyne]|uniref:Nose resistant-to-fluoxetine protein N-terminal domain-containing protein n=1 Tax=Parnassius mnemosyne TaxID=213953 RepID=A0AAV1L3W0_9NEOP